MRGFMLSSLGSSIVGCLLVGCAGAESDLGSAGLSPQDPPAVGQDGSAGGTPGLEGQATEEKCGNGLDDDRNGQADDHCPCEADDTQSCFVGDVAQAGLGACHMGSQSCVEMATDGEFDRHEWGPCTGYGEPSADLCNGADDDCNGVADDTCACAAGDTKDCTTICGSGTQTCASGRWSECSAQLPTPEVCGDGVDQDCSGADEPCPSCEVRSDLFTISNQEACDCSSGCDPVGQTSFTLGAGSLVEEVRIYGWIGYPQLNFNIVDSSNTTQVSGTAPWTGSGQVPHIGWYVAGDLGVTLSAGTYALVVDQTAICANPSSGGQGFVQVMGC